MAVTDITDQFPDVNPYDRIYSSASGYTVKVRVAQAPTGDPGRLSFIVTGSHCDDATGQAIPVEDGWFIVEPHEVSVHSDSVVDLAARIEEARLLIVGRVECAVINQAAAAALSGVLPL